jgi:branched-chain amino acid transport system substrate-binding protein
MNTNIDNEVNEVTRRQFLIRSGAIAGSAVVAPGLLSGCGADGGGGGESTFKVGAVLELSGADATGGQLARRGYQFWVDTVNQKGGIAVGGKKYKVEMVVADCKSQPDAAADAITRLAEQEKVDALFGSYTSGVQIAMNPICQKYQTPCIAGSAESPASWSTKPQFAYGIIPAVDLTADKALKFIVESASAKPASAVVLGANEPFSKDAAAGFAKGAKEAGVRVLQNSLFPPEADLTPIITGVAAKKPDILAVGGHDTVLIDVVKAATSVKFTPKALIMHYGVTEPSFADELKQDADGVCGLVDWTPEFPYRDDVFGTAKEFADNYRAKYKNEADYTAAGCSVSGEVLQLALQKLGKPPHLSQDDRVKLNQIIAQTNIKTFYGPITFESGGDHFHDNTAPPPVLVQIQKGKIVAVAPDDVKKGAFEYPLAPFGSR